jgi:hypothetical protein
MINRSIRTALRSLPQQRTVRSHGSVATDPGSNRREDRAWIVRSARIAETQRESSAEGREEAEGGGGAGGRKEEEAEAETARDRGILNGNESSPGPG